MTALEEMQPSRESPLYEQVSALLLEVRKSEDTEELVCQRVGEWMQQSLTHSEYMADSFWNWASQKEFGPEWEDSFRYTEQDKEAFRQNTHLACALFCANSALMFGAIRAQWRIQG